MLVPSPLTVEDAEGIQLPDKKGTCGLPAPGVIQGAIEDILDPTGLNESAQAAKNAITDLSPGTVPIMSDFVDPFNGNVEDAIATALANARTAVQIMSKVVGPQIQVAFDAINDSPLLTDADFK